MLEGHKIVTVPKSVVFFSISNDISESTIKIVLFSIASKNVKYLRMRFPEHTQIFYTANYKLLVRELEEVVNKW